MKHAAGTIDVVFYGPVVEHESFIAYIINFYNKK